MTAASSEQGRQGVPSAMVPAGAKKKQGKGKPLAFLVPGVVTGGLVPFASLALRAATHELGANPVSEGLNLLGLAALVFLVLSLACTPLKIVSGWTWPIRIRKSLGLLGFGYACAHVLTYALVDQGAAFGAIVGDIAKRPFIFVGFAAFVTLVPLAATSTASMLKRLGAARWRKLHRLAYVAATLGVVHFVWRVKKDTTEPAVYGAVLGVLLLVRVVAFVRGRAAGR